MRASGQIMSGCGGAGPATGAQNRDSGVSPSWTPSRGVPLRSRRSMYRRKRRRTTPACRMPVYQVGFLGPDFPKNPEGPGGYLEFVVSRGRRDVLLPLLMSREGRTSEKKIGNVLFFLDTGL